jgi:16S rRNA (cytidine1402-2'-O)-methyltransferase
LPSTNTIDGILYIVSTPIGNLQDVTLRGLDVLKGVSLIACEDTRMTRKLLTRYDIHNPTTSVHAHSREGARDRILGVLAQGSNVAYVTDSGTPTVSDPGAALVREVIDAGGRVVPIPGPSAAHAALAASGFSFAEYLFLGFLSSKPSRRRRRLSELLELKLLLVFYESPHRLLSFLKDAAAIFGEIPCVAAKEMTKRFEKFYRGNISEIIVLIASDGVRGEYTVILDNRN